MESARLIRSRSPQLQCFLGLWLLPPVTIRRAARPTSIPWSPCATNRDAISETRRWRSIFAKQFLASLEKEHCVGRYGQLAFLRARETAGQARRIISGPIVRMLETNFWPQENRCSDPMTPAKEVLGIFCFRSGPLPSHIIDVFVANGHVVVLRKLPLDVVDHRCFRRRAG